MFKWDNILLIRLGHATHVNEIECVYLGSVFFPCQVLKCSHYYNRGSITLKMLLILVLK